MSPSTRPSTATPCAGCPRCPRPKGRGRLVPVHRPTTPPTLSVIPTGTPALPVGGRVSRPAGEHAPYNSNFWHPPHRKGIPHGVTREPGHHDDRCVPYAVPGRQANPETSSAGDSRSSGPEPGTGPRRHARHAHYLCLPVVRLTDDPPLVSRRGQSAESVLSGSAGDYPARRHDRTRRGGRCHRAGPKETAQRRQLVYPTRALAHPIPSRRLTDTRPPRCPALNRHPDYSSWIV